MQNISRYSRRFRLMEMLSYFILLLPWIPKWLNAGFLSHGVFETLIKALLSAAALTFVFFLRDIRKKTFVLDRLKHELSMSAIHDLRGPLTSIMGTLSILSESGMDSKTERKLLGMATASSHSMIKLIQTLMDTDRMEVAKMILHQEELNVKEHVQGCLQVAGLISKELGVKLTISIEEGLPNIYADKDLLGRVYENLVLNAFKYSHRGQEIWITAKFLEGCFQVEIKDTGIGISPENIERVFDKFYRVQGQEGGSRKGGGLGLYFCRLVIEAHGGEIWAESEKGRYTRILFRLPQGELDAL